MNQKGPRQMRGRSQPAGRATTTTPNENFDAMKAMDRSEWLARPDNGRIGRTGRRPNKRRCDRTDSAGLTTKPAEKKSGRRASVFGGGGGSHEPKATGWIQDVNGGWFEVAIQPERPTRRHIASDDAQHGNRGGMSADGQHGDGGSQSGHGQQHGESQRHNRQRGSASSRGRDDPGQDNAEGEWLQNQWGSGTVSLRLPPHLLPARLLRVDKGTTWGTMRRAICRRSFGGSTSSSADQRVHPADVFGLAEGGEEQDPQEWHRLLQNVVSVGKVGAIVGRRALQRTFQLLQEPIVIDSQEGKGSEDVPTKVIAQILHHVLVNVPPADDAVVIPDEHLLKRPRPPLKRKIQAPATTPSGERSVQGEHVIKFMRRQADYDVLRVATGVVFTVAGVIKESPEFRNESLLLGEIAGEIHNIGRRIYGAETGVETDEAAQWELHLQEEEIGSRGSRVGRPYPPYPHWDLLAQQTRTGEGECWHNTIKNILGGNKSREEDDHSLMAISSSTSQASETGNRIAGKKVKTNYQNITLSQPDFCLNCLEKPSTS